MTKLLLQYQKAKEIEVESISDLQQLFEEIDSIIDNDVFNEITLENNDVDKYNLYVKHISKIINIYVTPEIYTKMGQIGVDFVKSSNTLKKENQLTFSYGWRVFIIKQKE